MTLLLGYVKKYKGLLFGALILATINQVFSLLDPLIFRLIIDRYVSRVGDIAQEGFLSGVGLLLLGLVGVALVSRLAKNFQDYFVNVIAQRVGASLYADSIAHSFSLPYAVFEDQRSGEVLRKMDKARTDAQTLIANFVNIIFLFLIGMIFIITYGFFVHPAIGATYLLSVPILGATTFAITRRIKGAQQKIVTESAELAGSTTETLRNVELVKSLGLEGQETGRLNSVNDSILGLELKKVRLVRALSFVQGTLINTLRVGLLFLMLWLIFRQQITIGQFFSLFFYSFFLFNPLTELGNVASQYQEARASMEALEEILATKPEEKPENPRDAGPLQGIEFNDVSFSYGGISEPAVAGINMHIKSGETIALAGPSGSGKTTIIKLLVGLYKPTNGSIVVNGTDSRELDYERFRQRIGYVSQETQLFAGTIRENLLFVSPGASDDDCHRALEQAEALRIIERGGKGLDTKIGEGGIKISGGERQRLAIARALLRNPDLIIFDEATSSLDSLTEKAITGTIQRISKERPNLMTVMVAHRLSTISHADRIYVLEKGSLAEWGSRDELLDRGGLYAALWRQQVGTVDAKIQAS